MEKMPFVYRFQKVLNYRITKKQEQIEIVKFSEREVQRIQNEIDRNKNTIIVLRKSMYTSGNIMIEKYDQYIKYLYDVINQLEEEKIQAIQKLNEEKEKLIELEKAVKVLEKHKEKIKEQYIDEQNRAEMKVLDEVAGLKHYAKTQNKISEELLEEGIDLNEY
jgi:flagellar export protein FliJ